MRYFVATVQSIVLVSVLSAGARASCPEALARVSKKLQRLEEHILWKHKRGEAVPSEDVEEYRRIRAERDRLQREASQPGPAEPAEQTEDEVERRAEVSLATSFGRMAQGQREELLRSFHQLAHESAPLPLDMNREFNRFIYTDAIEVDASEAWKGVDEETGWESVRMHIAFSYPSWNVAPGRIRIESLHLRKDQTLDDVRQGLIDFIDRLVDNGLAANRNGQRRDLEIILDRSVPQFAHYREILEALGFERRFSWWGDFRMVRLLPIER